MPKYRLTEGHAQFFAFLIKLTLTIIEKNRHLTQTSQQLGS